MSVAKFIYDLGVQVNQAWAWERVPWNKQACLRSWMWPPSLPSPLGSGTTAAAGFGFEQEAKSRFWPEMRSILVNNPFLTLILLQVGGLMGESMWAQTPSQVGVSLLMPTWVWVCACMWVCTCTHETADNRAVSLTRGILGVNEILSLLNNRLLTPNIPIIGKKFLFYG